MGHVSLSKEKINIHPQFNEEARDGRVLRNGDGDGGIRDSCHPRVDGVRYPALEEEIVGSSSCGGEQRDEAAEFVGILSSLDIVVFLAMKIPVFQVLSPNNTLLKQVDPGTR
ncbi:hypothetical protein Bca101_058543 [Brassica carinata]